MCYNRRVKECKEPLWITAAAFVMPEGGVGDAEEGTETVQALKKLSAETEDSCKGCDCCAEEM